MQGFPMTSIWKPIMGLNDKFAVHLMVDIYTPFFNIPNYIASKST